MKRIGRKPPRRILTRAESTRLVSLLFFLVVLGMLIRNAGNPDLWSHWVGQNGQQRVGDKGTEPEELADKPKPAGNGKRCGRRSRRLGRASVPNTPLAGPSAKRDSGSALAQATPAPSSAAPSPSAISPPSAPASPDAAQDTTTISNGHEPNAVGNLPQRSLPPTEPARNGASPDNSAPPATDNSTAKAPPPKATGPTDEDPDEQGAALEDFDAVEDANAVSVQPQEMQAYERLVRWVTNQPFDYLLARARRRPADFGEFIEAPEEHRKPGKLYQFDLQLRKLEAFPEPFTFDHSDTDPHDPIALYDAWGAADDGKGRLFNLLVIDPPKGMPLGNMLRTNVHFVGYFFKILAYEPARTLPGGKMLKAPILIGRIQWIKPGPMTLIGRNDVVWAIGLGSVIVLALLVWTGSIVLGRKRRSAASLATERSLPPGVTIDDWLEQAESGDLQADDETSPPPLVIDNREAPHGSNGHAKEGGKLRAEE